MKTQFIEITRTALSAVAMNTIAVGVALFASLSPAQADPALLRNSVHVSGDTITVGDLWDNAGPKADTPLARAPQAGRKIILEARWLSAVAQAYGVDWKPLTLSDRAVVERATRTVSDERIQQELLQALQNYGVPPDAEVDLANRQPIVVASEDPDTIAIHDLVYDDRLARFSATLETPAGSADAIRTRISGRVFVTTKIPVLTHAVNTGDIITVADLDFRPNRSNNPRPDLLTDPKRLIGQSARHLIQAGVPILAQDVQRPLVITKGSMVTLTLTSGAMTLTTQGRAIEDGALGDTVRVTNTSSNMTVEGRAEGMNRVAIAPLSRVLAN